MTRAAMIFALVLTGCADEGNYVWTRGNSTYEERQRDAAQCRNEARTIAGTNRYVHFDDAFADCLRGRGFYLLRTS